MPDSNDGNVPLNEKRGQLPLSMRRFFRGISHDFSRRSRLKLQHIAAAVLIVEATMSPRDPLAARLTMYCASMPASATL